MITTGPFARHIAPAVVPRARGRRPRGSPLPREGLSLSLSLSEDSDLEVEVGELGRGLARRRAHRALEVVADEHAAAPRCGVVEPLGDGAVARVQQQLLGAVDRDRALGRDRCRELVDAREQLGLREGGSRGDMTCTTVRI